MIADTAAASAIVKVEKSIGKRFLSWAVSCGLEKSTLNFYFSNFQIQLEISRHRAVLLTVFR